MVNTRGMQFFASVPIVKAMMSIFLVFLFVGCAPTTPVTLNEFVASNATGFTDDAGGTPDWIELYNNDSEDASLDEYFITDDSEEPEKHALDGLSVPSRGYLLLLASGDPDIGETHLSFRLSAAGEEIVFSGPNGVVDEITFGEQVPDEALARIPDGIGEWQETDPTPEEANE